MVHVPNKVLFPENQIPNYPVLGPSGLITITTLNPKPRGFESWAGPVFYHYEFRKGFNVFFLVAVAYTLRVQALSNYRRCRPRVIIKIIQVFGKYMVVSQNRGTPI